MRDTIVVHGLSEYLAIFTMKTQGLDAFLMALGGTARVMMRRRDGSLQKLDRTPGIGKSVSKI